MSPAKYISKILLPSTWGGAIELSIFTSHYQTEIASVDVETGRVDQFTPKGLDLPENRCLVIYSGIYYDAASLAPMADVAGTATRSSPSPLREVNGCANEPQARASVNDARPEGSAPGRGEGPVPGGPRSGDEAGVLGGPLSRA